MAFPRHSGLRGWLFFFHYVQKSKPQRVFLCIFSRRDMFLSSRVSWQLGTLTQCTVQGLGMVLLVSNGHKVLCWAVKTWRNGGIRCLLYMQIPHRASLHPSLWVFTGKILWSNETYLLSLSVSTSRGVHILCCVSKTLFDHLSSPWIDTRDHGLRNPWRYSSASQCFPLASIPRGIRVLRSPPQERTWPTAGHERILAGHLSYT